MTPSERKEAILDAAVRHGAVCVRWIHPRLYGGLSIHSAEKDLCRLAGEGLLKKAASTGRTTYYVPAAKLAAARGCHHWISKRQGAKSLANRIGVAEYCHRHGLRRLTAAEFKETFPLLADGDARPTGQYYATLDTEGNGVLGWVEVDADTRKSPTRLVSSTAAKFRKRMKNRHWRAVINDGTFHVVIATPTEGKRKLLVEAVRDPGFEIYITTVPEIREVLLSESAK